MSFIQKASCNTFTLIFVIVLITCLASIDCRSLQEFGRNNNDHRQVVDQQARQSSLNPTMTRNNQHVVEQVDNSEQLEQVNADANIGQIRSARAREEVASSGAFMEPKRRKSKRLQMTKDELLSEELQMGQQQREEKAKQALRKRWHRLADDIIDDVFANQQQQKFQLNDDNSMKSLDSSFKKKKWFTKRQQQQREDDSDNGFEKIMILMKKPMSESADSDVMSADNGNSNNLLLTSQPQQTMLVGGANEAIGIQKPSQYSQPGDSNLQSLNSIRRPNVNMQEHARRILDDKFGIMKESIFTTNNHLGLKGVPKLGSDEEY